mgnify:CR=1 FL=1
MTKKKNVLMRSAGLLLALVLVTSCFVGSTFAKYTTAADATESARVAKFGVTVTANAGMFAKEYATDDPHVVGTIAKSVISTDEVVAPGTKKEGFVVSTIAGTPEVAVRVSYEAKQFELTNWTTTGTDEYCPLVFTVNGVEYKIGGKYTPAGGVETDITTVALLEKAVKDAIKAYTKDYAPGTNLSGVGADTLTISWEWPFETGTNDTEKLANNAKDTALGNRAAAGNAATVSLTLATTVTQID